MLPRRIWQMFIVCLLVLTVKSSKEPVNVLRNIKMSIMSESATYIEHLLISLVGIEPQKRTLTIPKQTLSNNTSLFFQFTLTDLTSFPSFVFQYFEWGKQFFLVIHVDEEANNTILGFTLGSSQSTEFDKYAATLEIRGETLPITQLIIGLKRPTDLLGVRQKHVGSQVKPPKQTQENGLLSMLTRYWWVIAIIFIVSAFISPEQDSSNMQQSNN